MILVKFNQVYKQFAKESILKGVSFEIPQGQFCLLVGQNGAGKSTILNLASKEEFHDAGEIHLFGENILDKDFFHNQRIAFVHERVNFKLPMNMDKFINIYKKEFKNWDQELFDKMIKDREIDLSKKFANYSRGQKMQISLMLAIARKPEIFFLDEITSVIDLAGQKYFLSILRNLCDQGHTVVLTTNILSEAQSVCDRLIYLRDGKIEIVKSKNELIDDFIKIVVPAENINDFMHQEHITVLEKNSKQVQIMFERKYFTGKVPEGCFELVPSFEDIFIHYYRFRKKERKLDVDAA